MKNHNLSTIGIDINEANVKERVGTGQYTYHLLKRLSALAPGTVFHLYHRDPLRGDLPAMSDHWQYHRVGPSRAWLKFSLPLHLMTHPKSEVWWSPAHYLPFYTGTPSVVTIHDLAYEFFPDLFLPSDLYKLKNWTRSAVRQASKVIAVSQATKNDLLNLYNIPESKIVVVHNGYDSDIFNLTVKASSTPLTHFGLKPHRYLLFLGTVQPRKNVIKLVQAFHLLKDAGYPGKLVIAGRLGWLAEESLAVIKNSPHSRDIIMTGYIDDLTRKTLYTYCDAYVLPSLYEGFGLPAVEAMACGAPVAVANNSSLPEVVGGAGVLFNATDPVDLAQAITTLQKDRSAWIKKSLSRAKHFSWDKCALETLQVLERVK